jgi:outer membrane protein assembly factor BamA
MIREIRYEPLLQPVPTQVLAERATLHTGEQLRLEEVRQTIKQLFATGRYADIEIDFVPVADGVDVVIRTRDEWFVGPVEVEGSIARPPTVGELADATRLDLGAPLDDDDVTQAVASIRDLLQRNGLYQTTVEPQVKRDPEHQQVAITFQVDAGDRARLTMPRVTGDTRVAPDELAHSAKYHGWFRWKPATDTNVRAGLNRIRQKYDEADRLTASVDLSQREYLKNENRVRPVIAANGGPRVTIETSGAKVGRGNLKKYVPVFDVQTVNRDLLVIGVRNLRDYFQNKGYFDAQVDFKIQNVNSDLETVTYTIGWESGRS